MHFLQQRIKRNIHRQTVYSDIYARSDPTLILNTLNLKFKGSKEKGNTVNDHCTHNEGKTTYTCVIWLQ